MSTNILNPVTTDNNETAEDTNTIEINQHSIVNILEADSTEEVGTFGYIIDPELSPDGKILVCDINKEQYEVSIERIQVYPPHEVMIIMNRYKIMMDVMSGVVDPDQFTQ